MVEGARDTLGVIVPSTILDFPPMSFNLLELLNGVGFRVFSKVGNDVILKGYTRLMTKGGKGTKYGGV